MFFTTKARKVVTNFTAPKMCFFNPYKVKHISAATKSIAIIKLLGFSQAPILCIDVSHR